MSWLTALGPIIKLLVKITLNWVVDFFETKKEKKELHKEARKEARSAAKSGDRARIAAADNKLRISR